MPAEALRLVMVNLLGNALKYATPLTTVRVAARPVGPARLAVSVTNAGPPITAADRERIFEPFVQLDSSLTRSASGVGLGLHIVRRLVDSYGGTVEVESADGLVTFTIVIPAVVAIAGRGPARPGAGGRRRPASAERLTGRSTVRRSQPPRPLVPSIRGVATRGAAGWTASASAGSTPGTSTRGSGTPPSSACSP